MKNAGQKYLLECHVLKLTWPAAHNRLGTSTYHSFRPDTGSISQCHIKKPHFELFIGVDKNESGLIILTMKNSVTTSNPDRLAADSTAHACRLFNLLFPRKILHIGFNLNI